MLSRIAVASQGIYNGIEVFISPNGLPFNRSRIGELKDGRCISTPFLSKEEIYQCGLENFINWDLWNQEGRRDWREILNDLDYAE